MQLEENEMQLQCPQQKTSLRLNEDSVKQMQILNRLLLKIICILHFLQPSLVQCRNVSSDKHSFFNLLSLSKIEIFHLS